MRTLKQLAISKIELELSVCKDTCTEYQIDIFDESRGRLDVCDRSMYITLFSDAIQFVANCRADGSDQIKSSTNRQGKSIYVQSLLAERYFRSIYFFAKLLRCLSAQFEYHEYITVLRSSFERLGLLNDDYVWSQVWSFGNIPAQHPESEVCVNTFNCLVSDIEYLCRTTGAYRALTIRQERLSQRFIACCNYIDALFEIYARLVVVRVDLSYCTGMAQSTTPEMAMQDIRSWQSKRRYSEVFKGLVGYVIKMEYGIHRGVHFHALLFFDGSVRDGRRHIYLGKDVGEHWVREITDNRGHYWNSNDQVNNFLRLDCCGIGVIEHRDSELRNNLTNIVLRYLCKTDQFIRSKDGGSKRRIFKGEMPDIPKVKRGRKRLD